MIKRRFIALGVVAVLLAGGWILVSLSEAKYRVDFTSLVKMWSDVVRDTDEVGLTLTRVSDRKEMEFGAELAKRLGPSIVSDSALQKYVSEVGQRLVREIHRKGIRYEFHVINSGGINAFALPGGKIYVTTGMLKFAMSEAEIAGVIAHEISHVDLRHCIERFQYELLTRRILPSDLAAISRLPYSLLVVSYNEQQEREADVDAVIMMANAGYHPKYGISIFDRVGALAGGELRATPPTYLIEELGAAVWEALREYFQTHPSWPDRINTITAVLQRNEPKWKDQKFYVGRSNHAQRTSWTERPIDNELRPYFEPPAFVDYISGGYPHFKAMAVNLPSGLSSVASDEATPSAAIARALSQCERKIKPCQLYALSDKVVLGISADQLRSIISEYSKTSGITRAYRSYASATDFKALAVEPASGRTGTGLGHLIVSKAIDEAMARCAEEGGTCELYAVGDVVVQGMAKEKADAAIEQYRQRVAADRLTKLRNAYLGNRTYKDFKALAVNYQSGQSAVSQAQATPSKAIERAIAACSTETMVCEVHAIGDTVVQGKPTQERDAVASRYAKEVIERISGEGFKQYLSKKDFKAFVADVPRNFWSYQAGHWHPMAAMNSVLQRCRKQARDCGVVALGDRFVFDSPTSTVAEGIEAYKKEVTWPTNVRNPLREYMDEEKFVDFKAFAADPTLKNWQRESGYLSLSKAMEETVALCRSRNVLCELYAIGNHIVYGESDDEKKVTIEKYTREVLEKRLAFFRQSYKDFKAVAGNPYTMEYNEAFGSQSARDAVQEAMRTCSERHRSCQVFAVGDTIVFGLTQDRIDQAVEQYQRDVDRSRQM